MTPQQHEQSSTTPQNRRKKYVVHPRFQWKYALTLSAAVFLFCVILSFGLYASLHEEARRRVINPAAYTGSVFTVILSVAMVYSLVTAGVIGFWMIVTTHRVCGPVYVLEKHLQELADGRMPHLRPLRRKDEFKDVFATFSRALDRIRQDKESQLTDVNKALSLAQSERCTCEVEYREALESVAEQLEGIRSSLVAGLGQPSSAEKAVKCEPQFAGAL